MDEIGHMCIEHSAGGILAGIVSYAFSTRGILPITNEVLGILVSLLILYGLGRYSEKKYAEEITKFTSWIANGILPFYFVWMLVWIILINYMPIILG